ncbi:PREDICTED: uncharacterized protein LOC109330842 [Lupinus angustifolius]|uniref:uncharacterized protein LOC109330842 n=1 Tax=Lupinus angustifolius TaxID=3871 RepID=UPI00092E9035|nr:PREDICTED: uncharacterized protein LOC109330842 [Lupinus angustifolius]
MNEINHLKTILHKTFRIKDLGDLKLFLGFETARNSKGISLNQRKYALEIISDIGMLGCKPSSTPMSSEQHLHQDSTEAFSDPSLYRRLVWRLIYLTNSRPVICFSV